MSFFAFNKTVVPALNVKNFYEGQMKFYYKNDANDANDITVYDTEYEAMKHLIETVDLTPYYDFWAVYYNTADDAKALAADKRYANFVMVMARKTTAVSNNILAYLTQGTTDHTTSVYSEADLVTKVEKENETDIEVNDTQLINAEKDLTKIDGLGLNVLLIVQPDDTTFDVRDGFDVKKFDNDGNPITIQVLYDKAKELTATVAGENDEEGKANITLIDVTGTTLRTSLVAWKDVSTLEIAVPEAQSDDSKQEENIASDKVARLALKIEEDKAKYVKYAPVDDAIDIYRDYIDGYDKTLEELNPENKDSEEIPPEKEDEEEKEVIANDSDYITV
jgi:hypothetical protein